MTDTVWPMARVKWAGVRRGRSIPGLETSSVCRCGSCPAVRGEQILFGRHCSVRASGGAAGVCFRWPGPAACRPGRGASRCGAYCSVPARCCVTPRRRRRRTTLIPSLRRGSTTCGSRGPMPCVAPWPIAGRRHRVAAAITMRHLWVANGGRCRRTRCCCGVTIRPGGRWCAGRRRRGFYVSCRRRRVERWGVELSGGRLS